MLLYNIIPVTSWLQEIKWNKKMVFDLFILKFIKIR